MKHRLNVLDDFQCLAGDCPQHCCQGWSVSVNSETLNRWQAVESVDVRKQLLDGIYEKEQDGGDKRILMKLQNDDEQRCVQMDGNGLCQIQTLLGHEYLPDTCQRYPRIERKEPLRHIESANLSCPEISRRILEIDALESIFSEEGVTSAIPLGCEFDAGLASAIDQFVQQTLCDARFGIGIRLLAIANVLCELVMASGQDQLDDKKLRQIFKKPRQRLYDLNQQAKSRRVTTDAGIAGRFWLIIYNWSKFFKGPGLLDEFKGQEIIKLAETAGESEKFYHEFYQSIHALRESSKDALGQFGDYGAKYLMLKFVNNGFPMNPHAGNFVASFLFCVFPYALLQLHLWLIYAERGNLSLGDVSHVINRVERWLGHEIAIYEVLNNNPMFLRLDMYKECLLDC